MHTSAYAHTPTCMHAHTHTRARTHTHTRARARTHTHARAHTHTHINTHTHAHTHTHIHIHTSTHLHVVLLAPRWRVADAFARGRPMLEEPLPVPCAWVSCLALMVSLHDHDPASYVQVCRHSWNSLLSGKHYADSSCSSFCCLCESSFVFLCAALPMARGLPGAGNVCDVAGSRVGSAFALAALLHKWASTSPQQSAVGADQVHSCSCAQKA